MHRPQIISLVLLFVFVCISVCFGQQTTLPVSNSQQLLQAIDQIAQMRVDGKPDRVIIELAGGIYPLEQTVQFTPELVADGLTLKAVKSRAATVSGGVTLDPKGRDAEGRWRFPLPEDWQTLGVPREILIDDLLATAARWPDYRLDNQGHLRIEKSLEDRRSGFSVNAGDLPENFQIGDHICDLVFLHDWSSSRLPVASYDPTTRVLRTIGPIGRDAPHYAIDHFEKQPRYWLEGHPQFADQPGEWFIDQKSNEIVVIAKVSSEKPPAIVLPRLIEILHASGTDEAPLKNFSLEGIRFTGTRFPMPAGGLAVSQATNYEARNADGSRDQSGTRLLDAAVVIEQANAARVVDCEFDSLGTSGLWIGSRTRGCVVDRCRFKRIAGNAINIGEDNSRLVKGQSWYKSAADQVPTGNKITRCTIRNCGEMLFGSVAIWAGLNRQLEIANNQILDCPYTGISLGWLWNPSPSPAGDNHIHHNRIEYVMQLLSDGGGIYTLGQQQGTIIELNTISDIPTNAGRAESNGMFLDEGTTGLTIRENTIRRVARSPLRFHQAGANVAAHNHWELATEQTPHVRYNSTPEANISLAENEVLAPQQSIFLIGNSLTWDTLPPQLDGNVHWHVDCGKSLPFIRDNPENPCVETSRIWPQALARTQHDIVSVQPHYGSTLDEDVAVISQWMKLQPQAIFVIHSGWSPFENQRAEYIAEATDQMVHSPAYIAALLQRLQELHPDRELRQTHAIDLLDQIARDIDAGKAPIKELKEIYRDVIHLTNDGGRYLAHNAMRKALGQPLSSAGFDKIDPGLKQYFDELLQKYD